ncbi:hypothetical protein [Paenibacillus sp. GYB003]|uniref:hypothetical protein n=1 Tax=Paenibacillus sp. GYB003 TaxID=2994392 RepID=UPI002F9695C0
MLTRKRGKTVRTLILCVLAASLCLIHKPSKVRATWLWDASLVAKDAERIVSFAEQNRINLLYLQIDRKLDFGVYRAFIEKASESGIAVHALDGDPSWAKEENKPRIAELVDWVKSYNEEASSLQRLKGIHLDVEPYNRPGWETGQRQSIVDGWMAAIEYFTDIAGSLNDVELGADVPFWLDEIPANAKEEQSLSRWMIEKLDHITIMAYRDRALSPGGIVEAAKNEVETASVLGKKAIVAVETNPTGESYTTFYGKDAGDLMRQTLLVEKSFDGYAAYQGIAVHDYTGWSNLAKRTDRP